MPLSSMPAASAGGGIEEGLRGVDLLGVGAQHGQVRVGRQAGRLAFLELIGGEGGEVVPAQRRVERVLRMPGLHPHLRALRMLGGAAGTSAGLHQQCEQALGRAEVAAEECAVRVHRGHQRDAAEVVTLGDHLRADQHVDFAGVHRAELRLERALQPCAVGIDARHARGAAVRAGQQHADLLLEAFGAAADRRDVEVARTPGRRAARAR